MSAEGEIMITTKMKEKIDVPTIISQENSSVSSLASKEASFEVEKIPLNKKSSLQHVGQSIGNHIYNL